MGLFPRGRGRLPAGVADDLGIEGRERIVAWGTNPGSAGAPDYIVATDRALYLGQSGERLAWDAITKATWSEPSFDLVIAGSPTRRMRLTVADSGDLPAAVHDRVTASVVVSERLDLGDGRGAMAVARRPSDADAIRWSVVFDAGLDPSDPELRAEADRALSSLRRSLGI
ncbi:MAG: hypothetical protein GC156_03130 [Actinomycetales bacterium]|nr:hypothetical protein [Actinomycetales bacterium]